MGRRRRQLLSQFYPLRDFPTDTRTYASCCLCVCLFVCVCVSHFESLIEIINSKTNGFLLQFRSTRRETDARTKDLCQFFLSFFFFNLPAGCISKLLLLLLPTACCQGCSRLPSPLSLPLCLFCVVAIVRHCVYLS